MAWFINHQPWVNFVSAISPGWWRPQRHRLPPDDQQPGSVCSRSRFQPQILSPKKERKKKKNGSTPGCPAEKDGAKSSGSGVSFGTGQCHRFTTVNLINMWSLQLLNWIVRTVSQQDLWLKHVEFPEFLLFLLHIFKSLHHFKCGNFSS